MDPPPRPERTIYHVTKGSTSIENTFFTASITLKVLNFGCVFVKLTHIIFPRISAWYAVKGKNLVIDQSINQSIGKSKFFLRRVKQDCVNWQLVNSDLIVLKSDLVLKIIS